MNPRRAPSRGIGGVLIGPAAALRAICIVLVGAALLGRPGRAALADPLTPTPEPTQIIVPSATATSTPTATATPMPTPLPVVTPRPMAAPRPTATAVPEARTVSTPESEKRHRRRRKHATVSATPTPTPAAAKRPRKSHHTRRHRQKHRLALRTPTPTATATPTPTPTQPITLQTEDSIKPVACNGPAKPLASHPFLYPPYRDWTSIVSYFDHDLPDFYQDGLIVTTNGLTASPDPEHHAADFPAYWNAAVRQYLYYDGHNGYDYNLSYQPVYAAAAGKVIFARFEYPDAPDHGYGKMVMIEHRQGYVTLYGHFSDIMVKAGERVKAGQEIGISGNTGHSSGPHLHFTVFHNCTPTDPYGWSGPGEDPLAGYDSAGETSVYLWARQPLVINPSPGFPEMSLLPAPLEPRLLLLRLPSSTRGTASFTRALRREAERARAALGPAGRGVSIDMLRGALDLDVPIPAARLYTLPDVASIAAMDTAGDARVDVLSALARAALVASPHTMHLGHARAWTGYVLQWQGRTILVGRGPKAERVKLRMPGGGRRTIVRRVQADPSNGSYAVDLGSMSGAEVATLRRALEGRSRHRASLTVQAVNPKSATRPEAGVRLAPKRSSVDSTSPWALLGLVALVLASSLASAARLRLRPGAKDGA